MKFSNFLLRVDGIRDASLNDCKEIVEKGLKIYSPEGQKYLYVVDTEIVEGRFFWMSCEYDDAERFRDYVVNQETGEKEANPRRKSQVEPRLQFFACFDTQNNFLYLNDFNRRSFLQQYLSDTIQKDFSIKNIYASVDEFCDRVKSIRGFTYTQVDNIYARNSDIFQQVGDMWGLDLPSKVQIKISYGDIPVHRGRTLIDRLHRYKNKSEIEDVIVIGCDDTDVEQTFDFSSLLKHIPIQPCKDANEHYDPDEVKSLLLDKLR
ncbi:hypothetical protein [Oscillibacter sp.]|uniref:hypothetical protein n=1 Tax=Oscillibacter sp. TaxID=1945593 RepID=UPI0025FEC5D1|nr:hypothetical protein [Oscillibacter sp.]